MMAGGLKNSASTILHSATGDIAQGEGFFPLRLPGSAKILILTQRKSMASETFLLRKYLPARGLKIKFSAGSFLRIFLVNVTFLIGAILVCRVISGFVSIFWLRRTPGNCHGYR